MDNLCKISTLLINNTNIEIITKDFIITVADNSHTEKNIAVLNMFNFNIEFIYTDNLSTIEIINCLKQPLFINAIVQISHNIKIKASIYCHTFLASKSSIKHLKHIYAEFYDFTCVNLNQINNLHSVNKAIISSVDELIMQRFPNLVVLSIKDGNYFNEQLLMIENNIISKKNHTLIINTHHALFPALIAVYNKIRCINFQYATDRQFLFIKTKAVINCFKNIKISAMYLNHPIR